MIPVNPGENALWSLSAVSLDPHRHGPRRPRGQVRAGELLNHLRPELVTVEISSFSLRYRRHHGVRWQRQLAGALAELPEGAALHLAIRRLAAQVPLPLR